MMATKRLKPSLNDEEEKERKDDLPRVTVGVLALQGAYREHCRALERAGGCDAREVRLPRDLEGLDGIILPGGESTTLGKLLRTSGLLEAMRQWTSRGNPTWGTCAGLILLANRLEGAVEGQREDMLLGLDVTVRRNFFGSQMGSFTSEMLDETDGYKAVFIRAPIVVDYDPKRVDVIGRVHFVPQSKEAFSSEPQDVVVAVRQGNLMGTSFHPELNENDARWHERFLNIVREAKKSKLTSSSPTTKDG